MRNLKKSSKTKRIVIIILLAITVCSTVIAMYIYNAFKYPFKNTGNIVINNNDTLYSVLDTLDKKEIIKNKTITKIYVKNNNINYIIKPGKYEISKDMTFKQFISKISSGENSKDQSMVTIPEGYNVDQIAEMLDKKNIISKDDFLNSIKQYEVPNYIKKDQKRKYNLEGFLFPDTYVLKKGTPGKKILDIMTNRFKEVIEQLKTENNMNIKDEEIDKLINMASVVEKEAKADSERSTVASVFYNRIKINMKLQSCATVLYSLGYHKDKLYEKDTKIQSPYNTYNVQGLPVGPICSPGKKSLQAALKPANTNYLYFVSKNDGTHFFTSDYNEFLKVKNQTQGS